MILGQKIALSPILACDMPRVVTGYDDPATARLNEPDALGVLIGETADRGQGLGAEAMAMTVDYCWRHLNLSRLWLAVFAGNAPARALYRRLGFAEEGCARSAVFIDGCWVDVVQMALLHPSRGG